VAEARLADDLPAVWAVSLQRRQHVAGIEAGPRHSRAPGALGGRLRSLASPGMTLWRERRFERSSALAVAIRRHRAHCTALHIPEAAAPV